MQLRFELILRPRKGWQPIDLKEAWAQRELLGFLVWRDIKIRYRQTLLGGVWAVLQPLLAMFIFTFFLHRLAGVKGDPQVPYAVFAFAGLSAWTFFANSLSQSSNSLLANQAMVKKVYFPRIFIPLGTIGAMLLDLALSLSLLGVLMLYYHVHVARACAAAADLHPGCAAVGGWVGDGAFGVECELSRCEVCGAVHGADGDFCDAGDLSDSVCAAEVRDAGGAESDGGRGDGISLCAAGEPGFVGRDGHCRWR